MRVACPTCSSEYNIDERRVPPGGLNVRCPKCQGAFPVRPPHGSATAVRLPGGTGPSKVALPRPPQPTAPAGATLRFDASVAPQAAEMPAVFDSPFAADDSRQSPFGGLATPQHAGAFAAAAGPGGAAPLGGQTLVGYSPPGLSFGEVDLGEPPAAAASGEDPLPCAPDASEPELPISPDPFGAAPGADRDDPFAAFLPEGAPDAPFAEAEPIEADPLDAALPPASPQAPAASLDAANPAPAVAPAPAGEDLEMLFDEGAAARAAGASAPGMVAAAGYRVRRRSGKTFGPYEEAAVVEMLCKGELLGNEDVSTDEGASFVAIGTIGPFADAMRRLMGGPPAAAPEKTGTLPRIALLSREAPSRVVEHGRRVLALRPSRLVLAVAAGVLVLAVGAGSAFTPYGAFFHRALRGRTGVHRPGATLLADGRLRLAEDGYPGTKAALELAARALQLDGSDREAKALYVTAASLLAQRFGGADGTEARSLAFVPDLAASVAQDPRAAAAVSRARRWRAATWGRRPSSSGGSRRRGPAPLGPRMRSGWWR